jgi:sugar phosphate isomerase/epimerase
MTVDDIDLLASYWTLAGDTYPGASSEVSPFPLRERIEVAMAAGWRGLGFVHADIIAQIQKLGMKQVKGLFADNNVKHVELEFVVDWHLSGPRRTASDEMFREDSTHHRKFCGEGALEVGGFIQAILDAGYRGYWGVEIISRQLRKLPLEVAARRSFETTISSFQQMRLPVS